MNRKLTVIALLTAVVMLGLALVVRADIATENQLRSQIAALDKQLEPIRTKVKRTDPDVAAAIETARAAQAALTHAIETAMARIEPKARNWLDERVKLQEQLSAMVKADMANVKKAPTPAPPQQ